MQIKTYLPATIAKDFDRMATRMEMSRYELALHAIQEFLSRDNPKAEAMKQKLPEEPPQGPELPQNPKIQQHQSPKSAGFKTQSEPAETSAKKPSTKSSSQPNIRKQSSTPSPSDQPTPNKQKNSLSLKQLVSQIKNASGS